MKHELYEELTTATNGIPLLLFSHKEHEYELHLMLASEQKWNAFTIQLRLKLIIEARAKQKSTETHSEFIFIYGQTIQKSLTFALSLTLEMAQSAEEARTNRLTAEWFPSLDLMNKKKLKPEIQQRKNVDSIHKLVHLIWC